MERGEPASAGESLYRLPFLVILPTKSRIAFCETQLLLRARNHRQSWSEFVIAELKDLQLREDRPILALAAVSLVATSTSALYRDCLSTRVTM
jgi:hypothetical protein